MNRYVIIVEDPNDKDYIIEKISKLKGTTVLDNYSDMLLVDTPVGIGYIETISGVKLVEEQDLYRNS